MRVGSLFTGYGGLTLAVEEFFGAQVAWTSDIDPGACKIIAHRFPGVPNLGDITKIDWSTVEPVDILDGGYPCQPFSASGLRKGTDDERHLWPYVREAIRGIRPRITILENVAGHRSLGFDRVLGDLAEDGLHVRWESLRAADVGAPHGRERVFILATDPESERRCEGNSEGYPEAASQGSQWPRNATGSLSDSLRRWGQLLGRPCPFPLRVGKYTGNAANPEFWEWLMGLPRGWVTGVPGLTHQEQIKALGNGVVPQQAYEALRRAFASQEVAA